MNAKRLLHAMLKGFVHEGGGVRVAYWDGSVHSYGADPAVTVRLNRPEAAWAIVTRGSLGVGEAYMDQSLEVEGPIDLLVKLVADNLPRQRWLEAGSLLRFNQRNNRDTQRHQIQHHYDIGNEFYRLWLDDSMTYSCAYFQNEHDTLEQAQENKRRHILRKLRLSAGMSLLDIGSGWGQLLLTAAREYGVRCMGITLSQEQYDLCKRRAQAQCLDHLVHFELINFQDFAKSKMSFDRIVSVGMYEHVGRANQHTYFDAIKSLLKPEGLSLLHTISGAYEAPVNAWIDRYIFPGGHIPSYHQVISEVAAHDFEFLDYEDLRMHYARTLDQWLARFEANLGTIVKRHGERFARMWRFYLATSAGSFRYRRLNLSQILFAGPQYVAPLTRGYMYPASLTQARPGPAWQRHA